MSLSGESGLSRLRVMLPLIAATIAAATAAGAAQEAGHRAADPGFPSRPIRLLVGFSPGGGTDIAVRIIGKKLSEIWGQQVVVDNRAGAGGLVAFEMTARALPDG